MLTTLFFIILAQDIHLNRDGPEKAASLFAELDRLDSGESKSLEPLLALFGDLQRLIARDSRNRVATVDGSSFELEAKSGRLFHEPAKLPPENKTLNSWSFKTVRLHLEPENLYVYSLRFTGSHTIRLRKITLYFKKGPPMVFDEWMMMNDGNGQSFSKKSYTPSLNVWKPGEARVARILTSIDILGSAQDGAFESYLDFIFEVPEPQAQPYEKVLTRLAQIMRVLESTQLKNMNLQKIRYDLIEALKVYLK